MRATPSSSVVFSYTQPSHFNALVATSPKELEGVRFRQLHVEIWLATVEGGTRESSERALYLAMKYLDKEAHQELARYLSMIPMPERGLIDSVRPFTELGNYEGLAGICKVRWEFYNRHMSEKYSFWPRQGSDMMR